jgi:hypothetical protein
LSHKRELPGHVLRHSVSETLLARGIKVKLFGTGSELPIGSALLAVAEFRSSCVELPECAVVP